MSERYELFVNALSESNLVIARMALYALSAVVAYPALEWVPVFIRRPLQYAYLAALLFAFVFVTVFSAGL